MQEVFVYKWNNFQKLFKQLYEHISQPHLTTVACLCSQDATNLQTSCLYISFVDPRTIGNELENKKRELDRPPAGRSKRFYNFFSLSIRYWNSGAHLSWQYFHLLSMDWIKLSPYYILLTPTWYWKMIWKTQITNCPTRSSRIVKFKTTPTISFFNFK